MEDTIDKHVGMAAARVPESYLAGLDRLVGRGVFANRSAGIRRAIYNLLVATKAVHERVVEPCVNSTNTDDDISKLVEEGFSLKSK
jgi:Arc/MetJ-type ribon-helix-helix transcriptional regulator